MTDYLAYATTATGVPITECEVCGQRHPERRFGRLCDTLGVSTERPQPVSLHLTSRGLAATRPHLQEGGIVVDPTVPETDPNRLVLAWCECCGVLLAKRASDRNRMHFDCWADHHCGPDSPWPPGHQCRTPRSDG